VITKVTPNLRGKRKAIEYDYDFTRVTGIRYPIFTGNNVRYTYGALGAPDNAAGRITEIRDAAGTVTRGYSVLGETVRETRTLGGSALDAGTSFTTLTRFDSFNRTLQTTYPDGEQVTYGYDSGGQVTTATGAKGGRDYPYLTRQDYDKFENKVLTQNGSGVRTTYSYDEEDRRLATQKSQQPGGGEFQALSYRYDSVGNVTRLTNDVPAQAPKGIGGPSTQTYAYDDLYQLTSATGEYRAPSGKVDRYQVDLAYDSIHNTTSKTQKHELVTATGGVQTQSPTTYSLRYTYDQSRPHAATRIGQDTAKFDANGNRIDITTKDRSVQALSGSLFEATTSDQRTQFVWDEENRLACVTDDEGDTVDQDPESCDGRDVDLAARFVYDDAGNRIVKDGDDKHISPNRTFSKVGTQSFKHVFAGDTRVVTKKVESGLEDELFFFHEDHLGSSGLVTDASGKLVSHQEYFPFGETWVSESGAKAPVPYQYNGKEFDKETGLYFYGARYLDPRTQLWQSTDPATSSYLDGDPNGGVFASANLASYTYVQNNPVAHRDPTGRWGRAGHQYTMEAAALAAGLPPETARALGQAAWAPDTDGRSATSGSSIAGSLVPGYAGADSRAIHLLTGENAERVQARADTAFGWVVHDVVLNKKAITEQDQNVLHSYGDSFAHVDTDPEASSKPGCPCMFSLPVGHAATAFGGHQPDIPSANPGQYRQYVIGLYGNFARVAKQAKLQPRMDLTSFLSTMMTTVSPMGPRDDEKQEGRNIKNVIRTLQGMRINDWR